MSSPYFLGADVGGTKTHVVIADAAGRAVGFGESGPGNHDQVGYAGLTRALGDALGQALQQAGLRPDQITAAGWGISGFDWPSQLAEHQAALAPLGISGPAEVVNDTIVGILAGAAAGWGIGLVAGTGCNCWGINREQRLGRAIGRGPLVGEAAGASDLARRAVEAIADEWTARGPATRLTPAFAALVGAAGPMDFLEGVTSQRYAVDGEAARLVFEVAAQGDPVAQACVRWAGESLARLASGVIRQLELERLEFDVVLIGSLFEGGSSLVEAAGQGIRAAAPGARLVRLDVPPAIGGVLLAMRQLRLGGPPVRERLIASTRALRTGAPEAA